MIEGIIGVVCTLIIYFLKRKLSYEQDKNAQLEDKLQETAEAIVEGDEEYLTLILILLLSGCKSRLVIIPSDKAVVRMKKDNSYSYPINGWFVPDARMLEIMEQLERDGSKATTAKEN